MPPRLPSYGGKGETAFGILLTENNIRWHWQVPVQVKYADKTFITDYELVQSEKPYRFFVEVDGGLHFITFKGRVAHTRIRKDEAKRACLSTLGVVIQVIDTEVLKTPQVALERVREGLKSPKGTILLAPESAKPKPRVKYR